MNILNALWPILLALVAGVVFGRLAPQTLCRRLIGMIGPLIWLMLFLIGHEFGEVLFSSGSVGRILGISALFALATTLVPGVLVLASRRWLTRWRQRLSVLNPARVPKVRAGGEGGQGGAAAESAVPERLSDDRLPEGAALQEAKAAPEAGVRPGAEGGSGADLGSTGGAGRQRERLSLAQQLSLAWPPLREALIALGMVALGALLFLAQQRLGLESLALPSSNAFLLLMIGIIGADLAQIRLSRQWVSPAMLALPGLVVVGSMLGGSLVAWLADVPLKAGLALSSGYGWFSLSSVMVAEGLGKAYGTMALSIDLLRELLAFVILYAVGRWWPLVGLAAAGATAMDSSLPIIKQVCSPSVIPMAMVSGFLLTLLAPFMMSLFLA
ncbi:lysine exporter LysO family protein [Lautropia mirabilis]|uniref:lysine exporter LysO family protein n=1 Tax=Lautropia mirabilis TaxID=47671 RepID=UPI0023520004|nr:lysine exporter LysO family protein [Lautropia mirabilis]